MPNPKASRKAARKIIWNSGPPPHVGWWEASAGRHLNTWRWWDGTDWSNAAYPDFQTKNAVRQAKHKWRHGRIEWTTRWPNNARVPRINPSIADAAKIVLKYVRRHEPDPLGPVLTMRDAQADIRGTKRPDNPSKK
jgi:hypothetical protein